MSRLAPWTRVSVKICTPCCFSCGGDPHDCLYGYPRSSEGFNLGTRLLVFDKVRLDPQAPNAFGARITYDIPLNETRLSALSGTAPDNVYALRG